VVQSLDVLKAALSATAAEQQWQQWQQLLPVKGTQTASGRRYVVELEALDMPCHAAHVLKSCSTRPGGWEAAAVCTCAFVSVCC
jgi:hypothetical protein